MRGIVSIEPIGKKEALCIKVNTVYGLYLSGDFIVTHNSDAAIGRQIRGATKHGLAWNGIMFRRKYKDLGELKRRFDELILKGMPAERRGGDQQTNFIEFKGGLAKGAKITLTAIQRPDQIDDWLGHQFTEVSIEEAPQFSFLPLLMDKIKGSIRSPHGVKGHLFLTGNPGGPGAGTVKLLFIDPVPWGTVNRLVDDGSGLVTTRVYIHSKLEDNQILVKGDPDYKRRLMSIQDPVLRAAWVEGRWDVYIGQAFHFSLTHHVIPKEDEIWPIPEHVPIYMTFDWGWSAPFSIGWWWVDDENRLYRFGEWYGWDGKMPNRGLQLTDPDIAKGILQHEKAMGVLGRKIIRLSGRDCFNRKPNYLGGGQGPATSDEFKTFSKREDVRAEFGTGPDREVDLNLLPGDPNRELKIRQFRNRLRIPGNGTRPMLVVYESTSRQFIRTIPSLCLDEVNIEALEEHQELHCYDEACHIVMARPLSGDLDDFQHVVNVQRKTKQIQSLDGASREAAKELFMINKLVAEQSGYEDQDMAKDLALNADVFGMGDADNLTADDIDLDAESMLQEMPWLRNLLP